MFGLHRSLPAQEYALTQHSLTASGVGGHLQAVARGSQEGLLALSPLTSTPLESLTYLHKPSALLVKALQDIVNIHLS